MLSSVMKDVNNGLIYTSEFNPLLLSQPVSVEILQLSRGLISSSSGLDFLNRKMNPQQKTQKGKLYFEFFFLACCQQPSPIYTPNSNLR